MSKGPPIKYPVRLLEVGDTISFDAPTTDDVRRLHNHLHQAAERAGIGLSGKINRQSRVITFTRYE